MTGLFDARDSGNQARRSPAPGPPATIGESASSAFDETVTNFQSMSAENELIAAYDRYLSEIAEATGKVFDNPRNPAGDPLRRPRQTFNGGQAPEFMDLGGDATAMAPELLATAEQKLQADIAALAGDFPGLDVRSPEDIRREVAGIRQASRERRRDVARREGVGGALAAFGASAAALALDPPVLASMVVGAPLSASVLRTALIEAGINVAVEIPIQAAVQARRAEFGEQASLTEALANIGFAGAGGFVIGGALKGAAVGVRGLVEKSRGRAARRGLRGQAEADAAEFLARKIELEEESPFTRDAKAQAEHTERSSEALAALREGRPARIPDEPASPLRGDVFPGDRVPRARGLEGTQFENIEDTFAAHGAEIRDREAAALARTEADKRIKFLFADVAGDAEKRDALIKGLRQIQKRAPVTAQSLTQFLVRSGGLKEDAGELAALGITSRTRPGLIRKKGEAFDKAARRAFEEGFFPERAEEPDTSDFLEALADDFTGRRMRFRPDDEARSIVAAEEVRAIEDISDAFADLDVDFARADPADIGRAIDDSLARRAALREQTPAAAIGIAEARVAQGAVDGFEDGAIRFDAALERQVRDEFGDRLDDTMLIDDADGNPVKRRVGEVFEDLDGDEALLREFAGCVG